MHVCRHSGGATLSLVRCCVARICSIGDRREHFTAAADSGMQETTSKYVRLSRAWRECMSPLHSELVLATRADMYRGAHVQELIATHNNEQRTQDEPLLLIKATWDTRRQRSSWKSLLYGSERRRTCRYSAVRHNTRTSDTLNPGSKPTYISAAAEYTPLTEMVVGSRNSSLRSMAGKQTTGSYKWGVWAKN